MEKPVRVADKSLIQVILQKYRACSVDSITGPTGLRRYEPHRSRIWPIAVTDIKPKHEYVSSSKEVDVVGSLARLPVSGVATTRRGPSKVKQTLLDGIPLACFNIGGEKRLSLEQLQGDVLKEFHQNDVNKSRDHLKIYCPRCDEEQLEALKLSQIVPWLDSSCLLITKSDAYRLCSALLAGKAPRRQDKKYSKPFLDVYHECFGGCKGIFEPEIYKEPHAKCVTCLECFCMFSPRKFVTHTHSTREVQVCHWGMDSSKWRLYLLLPDDVADDKETTKIWEDAKKRFAGTGRKRRQSNSEGESTEGSEFNHSTTSGVTSAKKRANEGNKVLGYSQSPSVEGYSTTPASCGSSPRENHDISKRRSAFRPWSPLDEKPAKTPTTSTSSATSNGDPCPSHITSPFFHSPSHVPFMVPRNCSCPSALAYNQPKNGVNFAGHNTALVQPVKTEYPSVICTQTIVSNVQNRAPEEKTKHEPNVRDAGFNFASPETVKQVLTKYCHQGLLPSVDELSYALARELQDWSSAQAKVLEDVRERSDKLREEMNSLRRDNGEKLDEACAELKNCQEKLERLNRNREDDLKEFAKTREALQRQVENLQEQRSSDSDMVKKLMNELGERDTRCHLLEKELDYIRSWYVSTQRRYQSFQHVPALYATSNLRDLYCTQSAVIQEIPVFARNGESPALGQKSDGEDDHDNTTSKKEPEAE